MFHDNRKIGIGLCAFGVLLGGLGVLLLFDRVLLALANLAFILGIGFIIGPMGTTRFFLRREKFKGSLFYFGGLTVIIWKWPIFGLLMQLYGVWCLFNALLPNVVASIKLSPIGFIFDLPGLKQVGPRPPCPPCQKSLPLSAFRMDIRSASPAALVIPS